MTTSDPRWRQRQPNDGPVIDMTPDGEFIDIQARRAGTVPLGAVPLQAKVVGIAILVAVLAGAMAVAALALWLAFTLIPIAIAGAAIAYGVFRVQVWWARRHSLGGDRNPLVR